ncbi:MAG: serine hydrolase domain-containing protein [Pseudomonadota bacterium]
MTSFSENVPQGALAGTYDPRFESVAVAFVENFKSRNELGASVAVTVEGETVVNLWGGTAREESGKAWEEDTMSIVWSSTKGAAAFCMHVLASRGEINLNARVTDYWPEYGASGKENTTLAMLLNHQSGSCAVRDTLPEGAYANPKEWTTRLAAQQAYFEPGAHHGYEALTFGFLLGEVIERVTGKTLGAFFREEIAEPLGIPFWIGLPEELEDKTARMIMYIPGPDEKLSPMLERVADKSSLQYSVMGNAGGYMVAGVDGIPGYDTRAAHGAEIGAAGGITNGRGLAGMYAPLAMGGSLNGREYVSADQLLKMSMVSSAGLDFTLLLPTRFSLGYFKAMDNRAAVSGVTDSMLISEAAFGHPGFGGSIGFADPECRMSFGYTMNRMGAGMLVNTRGQSMIDALYQTLGYTSNASGAWQR